MEECIATGKIKVDLHPRALERLRVIRVGASILKVAKEEP
jgi:hypothetical protein